MRKFLCAVMLVSILGIGACGTPFTRITPLPSDEAVVYVYNGTMQILGMGNFTISIYTNDKVVDFIEAEAKKSNFILFSDTSSISNEKAILIGKIKNNEYLPLKFKNGVVKFGIVAELTSTDKDTITIPYISFVSTNLAPNSENNIKIGVIYALTLITGMEIQINPEVAQKEIKDTMLGDTNQ